MIFLILSIICSACLLLVFKWIERSSMSLFPVVVVNYVVCSITGIALNGSFAVTDATCHEPWFPFAILLGFLFISVFYLVGLSTHTNGVAPTAVAFKLSVVIPVTTAFLLYQDTLNSTKMIGIALALIAIYLSSRPAKDQPKKEKRFPFLLPALVFLGSGTVDAIFNYVQRAHLNDISFNVYLVFLFGTASILGLIFLVFNLLIKKIKVGLKEVFGGICLGLPNYGSVFFMLKALSRSGIESSAIWPINNIGIIILSTGAAFLIFREKVTTAGIIGIGIAIVAIILIALSA